MVRTARWLGWALLISGVVLLLYAVYLLWFTGFETQRSQDQLATSFAAVVPAAPRSPAAPDGPPDQGPPPADDAEAAADPVVSEQPVDEAGDEAGEGAGEEAIDPGDAYAALWFERDGERVVHDEVLYVVEGVTTAHLRAGPGHYPESDPPGGAGNFAVAGHRTTYGSPFWALNELRDGDRIHVVDRDGSEWVYAYREQRIVAPEALWVLRPDPLGTGAPSITLTTCHPRGSAAQRLVAFGELVGDPRAEAGS